MTHNKSGYKSPRGSRRAAFHPTKREALELLASDNEDRYVLASPKPLAKPSVTQTSPKAYAKPKTHDWHTALLAPDGVRTLKMGELRALAEKHNIVLPEHVSKPDALLRLNTKLRVATKGQKARV